jgi:hypothetical protein
MPDDSAMPARLWEDPSIVPSTREPGQMVPSSAGATRGTRWKIDRVERCATQRSAKSKGPRPVSFPWPTLYTIPHFKRLSKS